MNSSPVSLPSQAALGGSHRGTTGWMVQEYMVTLTFDSRSTARLLLLSVALCGVASGSRAQQVTDASTAGSLPGDLSVGVVEQTIKDHPTPSSLGKWGYTQGLTLYAMEQVYRRTHDARYLRYIQAWADAHVNSEGRIDSPVNTLDDMLPGLLMLSLYRDTGEPRYKIAAQTIRRRFDTYPRTQDGGFWHGVTKYQHQLWLDGMYMSIPFLVQYGEAFGDQRYAYREAARQLLIYAGHLNDPRTGLFYHAYDESGAQSWAEPGSRHSSFFWARSIGWYGMALVEVLETMPKGDPARPSLVALVRQLVCAFQRFQDARTGLWYNVVDKSEQPGNWLETSASAMYIYIVAKAVERGYVSPKYFDVACKGYRGILMQLSAEPDGDVSVANICAGTVVGALPYYLSRPRNANDIHGVGPFLLMNEQMRGAACVRRMRER
jgi:unsaturated rhamnogalacturonyl hydrolase